MGACKRGEGEYLRVGATKALKAARLFSSESTEINQDFCYGEERERGREGERDRKIERRWLINKRGERRCEGRCGRVDRLYMC